MEGKVLQKLSPVFETRLQLSNTITRLNGKH